MIMKKKTNLYANIIKKVVVYSSINLSILLIILSIIFYRNNISIIYFYIPNTFLLIFLLLYMLFSYDQKNVENHNNLNHFKQLQKENNEILNHLPMVFISVDKQKKILMWNQFCENIFGYLSNEVIGRNLLEVIDFYFFDDYTIDKVFDNLAKVNIIQEIQLYCFDKRGFKKVIYTSFRKKSDNEYILYGIDYTDYAQLKNELKIINDNMPFAIYRGYIDSDNTVIINYFSRYIEEIVGYEAEYLIRDNKYLSLVVNEDYKRSLDNKLNVEALEHKQYIEYSIVDKYQNRLHIYDWCKINDDNTFTGYIYDKTPSKELSRDINKLNEIIKEISYTVSRKTKVIESIIDVSNEILKSKNIQSLCKMIEYYISELTNSSFGYIGYLNNDETLFFPSLDFEVNLSEINNEFITNLQSSKVIVYNNKRELLNNKTNIDWLTDEKDFDRIIFGSINQFDNFFGIIFVMDKEDEYDENDKDVIKYYSMLVILGFNRLFLHRAFERLSEHQLSREYNQEEIKQIIKDINNMLTDGKDMLFKESQLKSEFLTNISHQIRTPLNNIIGFVHILLLNRENTAEDIEFLNDIKESGQYLLKLMDNIFMLSKIEAGKVTKTKASFNLNNIIYQVVNRAQKEIKNKHIMITVNVDYKIAPILEGDDEKLKLILDLLISNSIKFTKEGRISIDVKIVDNKNKQMLLFTVSDTGKGIRRDRFDLIFDPYEQSKDSSFTRHEGIGLSLRIVKSLLKLLGGKIWLESEVDVGSSFFFMLPYEVGDKYREKLNDTEEREGVFSKDFLILVADDDEINMKFFIKLLEFDQFRYITARNGKEAIEKARKHKPQLVFMDIQMPKVNGIEATRILKSDKDTENIPIIAVSAYTFETDRTAFEEAGFDDYIIKPIDYEIWKQKILKFLIKKPEK